MSFDVNANFDNIEYGARAHAILDSLQAGRATVVNAAADHGATVPTLVVAAQWLLARGYVTDTGDNVLEITTDGQDKYDGYSGPIFGE